MAQNNQINLNYENIASGLATKPLFRKFLNYFEGSASSLFRAIDFGQYLFEYYKVPVPGDDAKKVAATKTLFNKGFADSKFTDEVFIRLMLKKIAKDPGLLTFDMIADILESKAYQNFGNKADSSDGKLRNYFERGIYLELSKISDMDPVKVVYNEKYYQRILKTLDKKNPSKNKQLREQIKAKVKEFDGIYQVNDDTFDKLKTIAESKQNDVKKVDGIYETISKDEDYAKAQIMAKETYIISGGPNVERGRRKVDVCVGTNIILAAFGRRQGWTEEQINAITLKPKLYKNIARFEARANQINQASQSQGAQDQGVQGMTNPGLKFYLTDIAKTFGISAFTSTAISTVSAINPFAGIFVAGAMMAIGSTIGTIRELKKIKAEKKDKLTVKDFGKAIFKGAPMAVAYGLTGGLGVVGGMAGGAVGSFVSKAVPIMLRSAVVGIVGTKTFCDDVKRRADAQVNVLEQTESTQEKPKNFKECLSRINGIDKFKSVAYALGKTGATLLGGFTGRSVGSNISYDNGKFTWDAKGTAHSMSEGVKRMFAHKSTNEASINGSDVSVTNKNITESHELKTTAMDDAEQPSFKMFNNFKEINDNNNKLFDVDNDNNNKLFDVDFDNVNTQNDNRFNIDFTKGVMGSDTPEMSDVTDTTDTTFNSVIDGSDNPESFAYKMDHLSADDESLELTEAARKTVNAGIGRQWRYGVKEDLYTPEQQKVLVDNLQEKIGIDDKEAAESTLRKLYSLVRFQDSGEMENSGARETFENLRDNKPLTEKDAQNLWDALHRIDDTGDMIKAPNGGMSSTPAPAPAPAPAPQTPNVAPTSAPAPMNQPDAPSAPITPTDLGGQTQTENLTDGLTNVSDKVGIFGVEQTSHNDSEVQSDNQIQPKTQTESQVMDASDENSGLTRVSPMVGRLGVEQTSHNDSELQVESQSETQTESQTTDTTNGDSSLKNVSNKLGKLKLNNTEQQSETESNSETEVKTEGTEKSGNKKFTFWDKVKSGRSDLIGKDVEVKKVKAFGDNQITEDEDMGLNNNTDIDARSEGDTSNTVNDNKQINYNSERMLWDDGTEASKLYNDLLKDGAVYKKHTLFGDLILTSADGKIEYKINTRTHLIKYTEIGSNVVHEEYGDELVESETPILKKTYSELGATKQGRNKWEFRNQENGTWMLYTDKNKNGIPDVGDTWSDGYIRAIPVSSGVFESNDYAKSMIERVTSNESAWSQSDQKDF